MWPLLIKQRCSVALFPSAGEEDDQTKRGRRGELYRGPVMLQSLRRHLASITHLGCVTLLSRSFFTRLSVFFPPLLLHLFGLLPPLALCATPVYGLLHFPPRHPPFLSPHPPSPLWLQADESLLDKHTEIILWGKWLCCLFGIVNLLKLQIQVFNPSTTESQK